MVRLRVRELAETQGLDITRLARRADLGYPTVAALWNDTAERPALKTLAAVARVLGVKTGELIVDEAEEEQSTNKYRPALIEA